MKIELDDKKWKIFTVTMPPNCKPIGVVSRGAGDTGALGYYASTGCYVQVNAGVTRNLPQRQTEEAIKLVQQ